MKNIRNFHLKVFIFFVVKFSIYLNRHVFLLTSVMQKFITDFTNLWPVQKPSKAGEYYVFHNACEMDLSISQEGRWDDCRLHVSTKKHVEVAKLKTECLGIFQKVWEVGRQEYVAITKTCLFKYIEHFT